MTARTILTATANGLVNRWEAATGQVRGPALQLQGAVNFINLGPDGRTIIVSNMDGTVRLWDQVTRKPLSALIPHRGAVKAAVISADGRQLLTVGPSRSEVQFWPLPSPLSGTEEQIELWAEVATGAELDADGVVQFLQAGPWQERVRKLKSLRGVAISKQNGR